VLGEKGVAHVERIADHRGLHDLGRVRFDGNGGAGQGEQDGGMGSEEELGVAVTGHPV
jgi:hypothetical protein